MWNVLFVAPGWRRRRYWSLIKQIDEISVVNIVTES